MSPLQVLAMKGTRPLKPRLSSASMPFWMGLANREFCACRCAACKELQFPPREHCSFCGKKDMAWETLSGRGTVYSATTIYAAPELFSAQVPYIIVVLDLEEGIRLLTRWNGEEPTCGQAAQVVRLDYKDGQLFGAISA
jgi:uncharacterized OB-fold protein